MSEMQPWRAPGCEFVIPDARAKARVRARLLAAVADWYATGWYAKGGVITPPQATPPAADSG
ncbi:hypothetical protein QQG74_09690 [Micromonospora sp. FIMYZ51]|uniref:hypothetical protein n=1 Tax=Micromonospora sp. FIMYZ51 TaxID=3051832 RepID=UPI00311F8779